MPIPPEHDNGIFEHLESLGHIIFPLVSVIISLIVWTWNKMEKSIKYVHKTLEDHIESDDAIHEKLFDQHRESDQRLNILIGEHNRTRDDVVGVERRIHINAQNEVQDSRHNRRAGDNP